GRAPAARWGGARGGQGAVAKKGRAPAKPGGPPGPAARPTHLGAGNRRAARSRPISTAGPSEETRCGTRRSDTTAADGAAARLGARLGPTPARRVPAGGTGRPGPAVSRRASVAAATGEPAGPDLAAGNPGPGFPGDGPQPPPRPHAPESDAGGLPAAAPRRPAAVERVRHARHHAADSGWRHGWLERRQRRDAVATRRPRPVRWQCIRREWI